MRQIARKYNDRIGTRDNMRLKKYVASRKGYENRLEADRRFEAYKQQVYDKLPETVSCTISFQCCDASVCIPPEEKTLVVPVKK